jgi:branched-chain amino acid transport system substrate-binding protein
MLDSKALTKVQSLSLVTIIVVAGICGSVAYVLWRGSAQPGGNVIIGVVTDLDTTQGKGILQATILAAEQLNAQGGILGRNVTVVTEDDDTYTPPFDVAVAVNALTKLITVDKADYVIAGGGLISVIMPYQDICSEHKKILISVNTAADNLTQRVLDNYDRYKYFFKVYPVNTTTISNGMLGDIMTVGRYTGFTKVALLFSDTTATEKALMAKLKGSLPQNGFEVVYSNFYVQDTKDFSSYFAAIEASGAEILVPSIFGEQLCAAFVEEWYNRMSPVVVWGVLIGAEEQDFWELTEGKCDTVSFAGSHMVSGYPLTNKTVPTREAYFQRWGKALDGISASAYDTLRTILPDAIKRAGTFETEAVIKALEKTDIETSMARHFMFTSSHDVTVGGTLNEPSSDYTVMFIFQWQNGTQVPVKPESIMKEAVATYKYPDWTGPWSKNQTP